MAINLGSNFAKINNNLDNQTTTSGLVLNLQKNDININVLRPLGQAVKTPPSQGGIMGSIPVGVTNKII